MTSTAPGLDLLRRVRAAFIINDTTLKAWCRENGVHPSNARNAVIGSWNGPAGKAMRARIIRASGLKAAA